MNNRGQAVIFLLMLGVVVILLGLALAPALNAVTSSVMSENSSMGQGLNCTGTLGGTTQAGDIDQDTFRKGTCVIVDVTFPYFIASMFAIGGAIIGAKLYFATQ